MGHAPPEQHEPCGHPSPHGGAEEAPTTALKADSFFCTSVLSHFGHYTFCSAVRNSSSNSWPHWRQAYS